MAEKYITQRETFTWGAAALQSAAVLIPSGCIAVTWGFTTTGAYADLTLQVYDGLNPTTAQLAPGQTANWLDVYPIGSSTVAQAKSGVTSGANWWASGGNVPYTGGVYYRWRSAEGPGGGGVTYSIIYDVPSLSAKVQEGKISES